MRDARCVYKVKSVCAMHSNLFNSTPVIDISRLNQWIYDTFPAFPIEKNKASLLSLSLSLAVTKESLTNTCTVIVRWSGQQLQTVLFQLPRKCFQISCRSFYSSLTFVSASKQNDNFSNGVSFNLHQRKPDRCPY